MDYFIGALLAVSIIAMESIILIGLGLFLLFINYKIAIISFLTFNFIFPNNKFCKFKNNSRNGEKKN